MFGVSETFCGSHTPPNLLITHEKHSRGVTGDLLGFVSKSYLGQVGTTFVRMLVRVTSCIAPVFLDSRNDP